MLDLRTETPDDAAINVAAWLHPFKGATTSTRIAEGMTICQIVAACDVPESARLGMAVRISLGSHSSLVPLDAWHKVRPRAGAVIEIYPLVEGPALGALLSAVVAAAAPALAATLFPSLLAGSFGLALATTALTVVGQLIVSALIPPPSTKGMQNDADNFTITGAGNAVNVYGIFPSVIGRHLMFPPMTARGYTETVDGAIYWRGRYTFGYGPLALETLKIGTTDITDFSDVEIEFLNVDKTITEAKIPALVGRPGVTWRTGSPSMTLYPADIAEDSYSVQLAYNVGNIRTTRAATIKAQVDFGFQGLVYINKKGKKQSRSVDIKVEYRLVGATPWTLVGTKNCTATTTAYIRFTQAITFPAAGQYQIRVTRLSTEDASTKVIDKSYLSAIRSETSAVLPSNANISEVAIRIKASEQLNGQIDTLNAIVQQLVPIWNGSTWSAPVANRHPAWAYARALMGPQIKKPLAASRVDLDGLKAWADGTPHWTCDLVIDQKATLSEILDRIAASGRARRALIDLKFGVILDGAAGAVVQQFTPRNSFNFRGSRVISRKLHALRVRVVSERQDWQQDEVIVYNDGYTAANATNIETLDLPGVIIAAADAAQGNAWRLGRYHIAQAQLRPEEFSFQTSLDHLRCQQGDKIRLVHDVPLIGAGQGRIKSITTANRPAGTPPGNYIATIRLDETEGFANGNSYRLRVRNGLGVEVVATCTYDAAANGTFTLTNTVGGQIRIEAEGGPEVEVGDLVLIELSAIATTELLVKSIVHDGDLIATIRAVDAAPAVLTADGGSIPSYSPKITPPARYGPPNASIVAVTSGLATAIIGPNGVASARIGVSIAPFNSTDITPQWLQLRWRLTSANEWTAGQLVPISGQLYTGRLIDGEGYTVQIRTVGPKGVSRGWQAAGIVTASARDLPLAAPTGWTFAPLPGSVIFNGPAGGMADLDVDFSEFRLYASTAGSTALVLVATSTVPQIEYTPPASPVYTRYKITFATNAELESPTTAYMTVSPSGIAAVNLEASLNAAINLTVAQSDAATTKLAQLTNGLLTDVDGALANIEERTRAGLKGWLSDPIFSRWTSGNLTAAFWKSRSGLTVYGAKVAGEFGSALSINVPSGTGVVAIIAASDAGMISANPNEPYVVLTAIAEIAAADTASSRMSVEWSPDNTTWTRGDMLGLTAASGTYAQLGLAVEAGVKQAIEVLVKRPAGSFSYVRLNFNAKFSSNAAAHQSVWHLLQVRPASQADIDAGKVYSVAGVTPGSSVSVQGIGNALAAVNSGMTAQVGLHEASITDIKAVSISALTGTALGTLLTQLAVNSGGTSATVANQTSALALLNGYAAASYSLRLVAGGATPYFEIVATDDPVLGAASTATIAAKHIELFASSVRLSDAGNIYRDFDMLDESYYTTASSAVISFANSGATSPKLGARYIRIAPNAANRSLYSGWFNVEVLTEYLISGAAWLPSSAAGQGTATLTIEFGEYDGSTGVISNIVSEVVMTKTDLSYLAQHTSINFKTTANQRRARFKLFRNGGDAGEARAGGFKVQKKADATLIVEGGIFSKHISTFGLDGGDIKTGRLETRLLKISERLDIDEATGSLSVGKESAYDLTQDGIFFGRGESSTSFGFLVGKKIGGVDQYLQATDDKGLKLVNAAHFVTGAAAASRVNVTTSQTVTLPTGRDLLTLNIIGGGKGGRGGDGGAAAGNGGTTTVQLWDGSTNTGISWSASGATLPATTGSGGSSQLGNGGSVGSTGNISAGGNGSNGSGYGAGGGGGGGSSGNSDTESVSAGLGGKAAVMKTVVEYDISGYANPKLVIVIGAAGAGTSGGSRGGAGGNGSPGVVQYTAQAIVMVPASVLPMAPTFTGTITKTSGGLLTFPAYGAGFWCLSAQGSDLLLDYVKTHASGKQVRLTSGNFASFVSDITPVDLATSSTAVTYDYQFYRLGPWV